MKKLIGLMIALTLVLSLCACGGQPEAEQKTENGVASGEVTQADIEKNIVGTWIKSEVDGQPALTNEKSVIGIVSKTEAYTSASHITDEGTPFDYNQKSKVDINGNVVTITTTTTNSEGESFVHEFTINSIGENRFTANREFTRTIKGSDPLIKEDTVTFIKINDDHGDNIIGTWEGSCTSKGSIFDDGQDHRWEYKDDGTFVYYVKDGDSWVPSEDTMNEYFVAGNLLCTRWMENGQENREWWEISIDGDKMNWTALREDEDGKTFTATFEMTNVEE